MARRERLPSPALGRDVAVDLQQGKEQSRTATQVELARSLSYLPSSLPPCDARRSPPAFRQPSLFARYRAPCSSGWASARIPTPTPPRALIVVVNIQDQLGRVKHQTLLTSKVTRWLQSNQMEEIHTALSFVVTSPFPLLRSGPSAHTHLFSMASFPFLFFFPERAHARTRTRGFLFAQLFLFSHTYAHSLARFSPHPSGLCRKQTLSGHRRRRRRHRHRHRHRHHRFHIIIECVCHSNEHHVLFCLARPPPVSSFFLVSHQSRKILHFFTSPVCIPSGVGSEKTLHFFTNPCEATEHAGGGLLPLVGFFLKHATHCACVRGGKGNRK